MSFGVYDPPIEVYHRVIIGEQQEQILESFPQEEALHFVSIANILSVHDIIDGGVATIFKFCVLLKRLREKQKCLTKEYHEKQGTMVSNW